jgi:hypothetical protein
VFRNFTNRFLSFCLNNHFQTKHIWTTSFCVKCQKLDVILIFGSTDTVHMKIGNELDFHQLDHGSVMRVPIIQKIIIRNPRNPSVHVVLAEVGVVDVKLQCVIIADILTESQTNCNFANPTKIKKSRSEFSERQTLFI